MADDEFYSEKALYPCARVVWKSTDAGFDCRQGLERIWLIDNVKAGRFELNANGRRPFLISCDALEKLCTAALRYFKVKKEDSKEKAELGRRMRSLRDMIPDLRKAVEEQNASKP